GDNAGQAAALKGAILLSVNGFDGAVALFRNGDDPAEMMATGRAGEYQSTVEGAIPLIEFVLTALSARFNLQNPHEKNNALSECIAYLKDLNIVIATEYIQYISKLLGISEQLISLGEAKKYSAPAVEQNNTNIEDSLLFTMYMNPSLIDGCVNICHERTWKNTDLYWSIVQHKVTQNMMSGHLLDEKIVQLDKESFMALVKQKQKNHLLALRKSTRDFDEIIRINEKIKEVS
ncbi:MAG TPA: hypothetical protein EYG75_03095, partial [Campylobacterales bacterium]|nr:hypothetical protein [Campylobacterales bacterium]